MKLKLDANLGRRGRAVLEEAGYDVATAREQSLVTAEDAALIAVCREESRALVSLDTDFANPLVYPPEKFAGIVVIRSKPRATVDDIEAALRGVVAAVRDQSLAGRLLLADKDGRVREYRRPGKDD